MPILVLGVASFVAWFISMLAGGGSPFILIPLITLFFGAQAVAPVLTTGLLVGNAQRSLVFWSSVDWLVTAWYLPGAIAGAVLGSYVFTKIQAEWVQPLIAVALLWMVVDAAWSRRSPQSPTDSHPSDPPELKSSKPSGIRPWHFGVYGFFYAFGSGLIGSMGPIMNPLYLNYGLEKERMIATKSTNVVAVHIIKMLTYATLGVFTPTLLAYGLLIGAAAIPANWLGKRVLDRMSSAQFRQAVLTFVAVSGVVMLWEQRSLLMIW